MKGAQQTVKAGIDVADVVAVAVVVDGVQKDSRKSRARVHQLRMTDLQFGTLTPEQNGQRMASQILSRTASRTHSRIASHYVPMMAQVMVMLKVPMQTANANVVVTKRSQEREIPTRRQNSAKHRMPLLSSLNNRNNHSSNHSSNRNRVNADARVIASALSLQKRKNEHHVDQCCNVVLHVANTMTLLRRKKKLL